MGLLERLGLKKYDDIEMYRRAAEIIESFNLKIKSVKEEKFYENSILERLIMLANEPKTCAPYANSIAVYEYRLEGLECKVQDLQFLQTVAKEQIMEKEMALLEKKLREYLNATRKEINEADFYPNKLRTYTPINAHPIILNSPEEYKSLYTIQDREGFTIKGKEVYSRAKTKIKAKIENSLKEEGLGAAVSA